GGWVPGGGPAPPPSNCHRLARCGRAGTDSGAPPVEKVTDYDPELRARHFGLIQGIKASQLVWEEDPPGAESVEDFVRRCALALERHLTEPDTLIVAHGGVLRALAALLEQPLSAAERANATPLFVKREDKLWRIRIIPEPEALT